jgi:formate-dependent nitrite reductase membrane component NrfD
MGADPGELWGILIVLYLFAAGMGAGVLALSALCTLLGRRYRLVSRLGAMMAPWPVMLGTGVLLFDLGRPQKFYHLFMTVEWTSPMSVGSWLLTIFIVLALFNLFLWLPTAWQSRIPLPRRTSLGTPRTWKPVSETTAVSARRALAPVLIPVSLAVGIYTGVLLGAAPTRPFWNTPITAELFLFSAMSSGAALLMIGLWAVQRRGWRPLQDESMKLLAKIDVALIIVEFFLIVPFVLHQALGSRSQFEAVKLILGGEYTLPFWLLVVVLGLSLPLALEVVELSGRHVGPRNVGHWLGRHGPLSASVLVLVGGFALRYVFVYAGQVARMLPG